VNKNTLLYFTVPYIVLPLLAAAFFWLSVLAYGDNFAFQRASGSTINGSPSSTVAQKHQGVPRACSPAWSTPASLAL